MNAHAPGNAPFEYGWWSFDLGRYRACDGTYCYFDVKENKDKGWAAIPANLGESLEFLNPPDPANADAPTQVVSPTARDNAEARVAQIEARAGTLGLTLPPSFIMLMRSPTLQQRIDSCTACYFDLANDIVPCPASEGAYIVRFYNDQQDVLFWYLYLTPHGAQSVLVTPIKLEEIATNPLSHEDRQTVERNTWVCAPSFVSFIWRWWIENSIWFKVSESNDENKLTADERKYLTFYGASGQ